MVHLLIRLPCGCSERTCHESLTGASSKRKTEAIERLSGLYGNRCSRGDECVSHSTTGCWSQWRRLTRRRAAFRTARHAFAMWPVRVVLRIASSNESTTWWPVASWEAWREDGVAVAVGLEECEKGGGRRREGEEGGRGREGGVGGEVGWNGKGALVGHVSTDEGWHEPRIHLPACSARSSLRWRERSLCCFWSLRRR